MVVDLAGKKLAEWKERRPLEKSSTEMLPEKTPAIVLQWSPPTFTHEEREPKPFFFFFFLVCVCVIENNLKQNKRNEIKIAIQD